MKTLKLFLFVTALFLAVTTQAQVSVNVNLGSPPQWGPVGYSEARYYYLPDVEAYYDVPSSMFIYLDRGIWVHRTYLPTRYRNYDLYNGYKVVMTDYHGNTPYSHYREHRSQYARGYRGPEQRNIGERPDRGNSGSYNHTSRRTYNQYNRQENEHRDNGNHGNGNNGKHGNGNNGNHGNGNNGNQGDNKDHNKGNGRNK